MQALAQLTVLTITAASMGKPPCHLAMCERSAELDRLTQASAASFVTMTLNAHQRDHH
jgi:hypothetical protein